MSDERHALADGILAEARKQAESILDRFISENKIEPLSPKEEPSEEAST